MASAIVRSVHLHQLLLRQAHTPSAFGHDIERYWDRRERRFTVEVLPGQSYVAEDDELLTTVVGSGCCICVRHRQSHVSSMASLLLDFGAGSLRCIERCVACLDDLAESVIEASESDDRAYLEAWVVVGGDVGSLQVEDRDVQLGIVTTILLDFGAPVIEMHLGGTRPLSVSFEPRAGALTLGELQSPSIIDMRRDLERIAKLQLAQNLYEREAAASGRLPPVAH